MKTENIDHQFHIECSKVISENGNNLYLINDQIISFTNLLIKTNTMLENKIKREMLYDYKKFPRYFNREECISYLGKETVFKILVNEYGLEPIRNMHKGNIYCTKHLENLCIQFENNILL